MDWNRSKTFTEQEVKALANKGTIWRARYLWNGKLEEVRIMYECYCLRCRMGLISFNQWTPKYNVCIPCHIKIVKGAA